MRVKFLKRRLARDECHLAPPLPSPGVRSPNRGSCLCRGNVPRRRRIQRAGLAAGLTGDRHPSLGAGGARGAPFTPQASPSNTCLSPRLLPFLSLLLSALGQQLRQRCS